MADATPAQDLGLVEYLITGFPQEQQDLLRQCQFSKKREALIIKYPTSAATPVNSFALVNGSKAWYARAKALGLKLFIFDYGADQKDFFLIGLYDPAFIAAFDELEHWHAIAPITKAKHLVEIVRTTIGVMAQVLLWLIFAR